jgi:murein DD-endopeptidase MepM/ murein hydrolase activator NlpD
MRKRWVGLACCLVLTVSFLTLYIFGYLSPAESATVTVAAPEPYITEQQIEEAPQVKEPTLVFGIPSDSFLVINETIKSGQSLSHILQNHNISSAQLSELRQKSKKVFNLRQIRANRPYTLLVENDSAQTARFFIYQPTETQYVVFDLQDSLNIYTEEKELQTVERTLAGTIESSLYVAMAEAGCSPGLINHFADIYAWKINFGAVQPGDQFKLIYEEHQLDGEPVGYGKVKAAVFEHNGKEMYAICHGEGKSAGYYDEEGKSLQKAFLKEPLEYSRISSRFSLKRFHPVQKRFKAHLGTDFAAPRGTPIRSVGEGVVVEAGYNRGNGNYVKIKHDQTYTTQYLHMSKFAKGIKKGARVRMGQTIGFVGSTGLATGPHLCYRFWKNGKQVDPLREKLPQAKSIRAEEKEQFARLSQEMLTQLQEVEEGKQIIAAGENLPEENTEETM